MIVQHLTISIKGASVRVPAITIDGATVIVDGRFPRMASIADEGWVENTVPQDADRFVSAVIDSALPADVLTFTEEIDTSKASHPYYYELDNVAAADTHSFAAWWDKLPQATRKNCRRSKRRGARTEVVRLDDRLAEQIKGIYDESPIRQGRRFWHYGKDVETVKRENSAYLDRSDFIGTYVDDELIAFLKIVYVGRFAKIMQIVAKSSHYDKRPMNALIAKAVEVCSQKGMSHLIYSKFQYGNNASSSMIEFKIRNGFKRLDFPRYYVALTARGRVALACRLHRGLLGMMPAPIIAKLLKMRESVNTRLQTPETRSSTGAEIAHRDE
jgi:hypothetical protein